MRDLLAYLDARFGEASTYGGIAAVLAAAHVGVPAGVLGAATLWGTVAAGVLAVVIREAGIKSPGQVAADALNTLVALVKAMPAQPVADTTKPGASA